MRYTILYREKTLVSGKVRVIPHYYLDGVPVSAARFHAGRKPGRKPPKARQPRRVSGYPKYSEAVAVHPDQVEEARARAKRHGISVDYTPRGDAVIPDRGNWKKLLKLEGFVERS